MISKFPYIFNASCMIRAYLSHRNRSHTQFVSIVVMLLFIEGSKLILIIFGEVSSEQQEFG